MSVSGSHGITGMLQNAYPKAKSVWIRRAAEDLIYWHSRNPNPTDEQLKAQDERVRIMCTKGSWF
ncbi:hypothetical protein HUN41_00222 [Streptomyces phage Coruscant]|uniref:Uncharacterized protein n=1 Tax=Streptomyces phage Coruscant TaxID=2739834 RepID=A0A7G4AWC4_9CAUD|nr:hypothetical protein PP454_gp103 [Streptomyces phage Coruscant]QMP84314.1 hypothetical protein HUN41_00222 [Streptomyces phage Coruscant]